MADEPTRLLQVTYGAFSCTLEGFEDPVETLIAVAEFFRGLAARDPAFAGPLRLPDADELRRAIAQAGPGGAVELRIEPVLPQAGGAGPPRDGPVAAEGRGPQDRAGERMEDAMAVAKAEGPSIGSGDRDEPGMAAAPSDQRREGILDLSWLDDEDDLGPPEPAFSQLRSRDAAEDEDAGPDLDQLMMALARKRSPPPEAAGEPDAPEAAAEVPAEAAAPPEIPAPEPAPPAGPAREPIGGGAYDWGVNEEDDWFLSDEPVEPGTVVPAPDPSSPGRRWILNHSPDQDEAVLLRILSRAESKLSDPEIARRREAMAHLKAAVAATEAERTMTDVSDEEEEAEEEGIEGEEAEVALRAAAGERPGAAPLRLVAAQRVDLPRMRAALRGSRLRPPPFEGGSGRPPFDGAPGRPPFEAQARAASPAARAAEHQPLPERTGTERPAAAPSPMAGPVSGAVAGAAPDLMDRRIEGPADFPPASPPAPPPAPAGTRDEAPPELAAPPPRPAPPRAEAAPGGFADFARSRGATSLPQVLEAAAAWAGRPGQPREATRAELAALATEVLGQAPGREELLRVIGTLLREGRLRKLEGGRFRAAPGSRFDPAR